MKREDIIAYEIYVKSFKDSNGDGIGDLLGIIEKIEYLAELGINYIWLTPIYVSPQKDNGYDVQDYKKINPDYGKMSDFEKLIKKANKFGIEIMLDMVLNHTSIFHEWFQKAISGNKDFQEYYIFKKSKFPPTNWKSKFGGNAWQYVKEIDKWYLHLFDVTQADLNWKNKKLREELFEIVNFWKNKGVKGFRFDVINLISKPKNFIDDLNGDGRKFYTDGPKVHEYINELNRKTFGNNNEFATVGEMSSSTIENSIKYTSKERKELMMVFNFHHLKIDYKNGEKWSLKKPDFKELKKIYHNWTREMQKGDGWMANFVSNHDQPRHLSRYGNENELRYESATAISLMYFFLRGTPFIYFGEEIGMLNANYENINDFNDIESHNNYKILLDKNVTPSEALYIINQRSRDNGRIPMQWDKTKNAGFSTADPWLKISNRYKEINVAMDKMAKKSIFEWYKKIIEIRKTIDEFKFGKIIFNNTSDEIISYKRYSDFSTYEIIINLSDKINFYSVPFGQVIINNYSEIDQKNLMPYQSLIIKTK